jgi:hypothetical protein
MSLITCQSASSAFLTFGHLFVFLDFVNPPVTMQLLHLFFMCCILTDTSQCVQPFQLPM